MPPLMETRLGKARLGYSRLGYPHPNPLAVLSLSVSTLDFGTHLVGSVTTRTVLATNTGTDTLSITGMSLSGTDAARFAIIGGGSAGTLAVGASRTISLTFTPTASGTRLATLNVAVAFPSVGGSVALTGMAIATVDAVPILMEIATVDRTTKTRIEGLTVDQILNGTPDRASFRVSGITPSTGAQVRMFFDGITDSDLLFAGHLQERTALSEGDKKPLVAFECGCVDFTWLMNRRKVTARFVGQTGTAIIVSLITNYTSGFTTTNVEAAMPVIDEITFTNEDVTTCLDQVMQRLGGGGWFSDYTKDIHAFLAGTVSADPISDANAAGMQTISASEDVSQVRTRIAVIGKGTTASSDVAAASQTLPVMDAAAFVGTGTRRAQLAAQRITYTDVYNVPPGGSVTVGRASIGLSTPGAPITTQATNADGQLLPGIYLYRTTWVSEDGETVGGPFGGGTITAFSGSGTAGTPTPVAGTSGNLTPGQYYYAVTFENANGETAFNGSATTGTITRLTAPSGGPTVTGQVASIGAMAPGVYKYHVTFFDEHGETTIDGGSAQVTLAAPNTVILVSNLPISSDARTKGRRVYRTKSGGSVFFKLWELNENTSTSSTDNTPDEYLTNSASNEYPATNTSGSGKMGLAGIALGATGTTRRHLYRTVAGGSPSTATLRRIATLDDNATTTYTDDTPDSSLGDLIPATTTANGGQMTLAGVVAGPTGTTSRKVYRTTVGGSTAHYVGTIDGNVTSTFTDNVPDTSLGDVLGPGSIRVLVGDTEIPLSSTAAFPNTNGWARVGQQVIFYAGASSSVLFGIPASGIGSIQTPIAVEAEVVAEPFLAGVSGLTVDVTAGESVSVLVIRDDTTAQTAMAARTGGDGIVEDVVTNSEASITECEEIGDATLLERKDPIVTVTYTTRNTTVQPGRMQAITLTQPPISGSYLIQQVTLTQFGIPNALYPLRTARASSRQATFEALLRTLTKKAAS